MWNSINNFDLTEEEKTKIIKDLIEKESSDKRPTCPDCGVSIGENHVEGCDVARCSVCGFQRLGCECEGGNGGIWTGIWPGTLEALELGLVCCWNDTKEWTADLNAYVKKKIDNM